MNENLTDGSHHLGFSVTLTELIKTAYNWRRPPLIESTQQLNELDAL